jgi:hypothetical protein
VRIGTLVIIAAMSWPFVFGSEIEDGRKTLLIYDTIAKPFSLTNEIEPILIGLTRFDAEANKIEASRVQVSDIDGADFIVLVGVAGSPALNPECVRILQRTKKPLMCVGRAVNGPGLDTPKTQAIEKAIVHYRDAAWPVRLDPFFPTAPKDASILAEAVAGRIAQPLAWRFGNRFAFASLPVEPSLTMIFSDILLDFYGMKNVPASGLVFMVDDYHPASDPSMLRRLADYMAYKQIPFIVLTQSRDVPADATDLMPRETYMDSLRYAQARGARIFLDASADAALDREIFSADGVIPLGSESHPTISIDNGDAFTLFVGSKYYQDAPGGDPVPFRSHAPLLLLNGGVLLPENILGGMDGVALDEVRKNIGQIAKLRGGVAGVVMPAWLPFQHIRDLVDACLESGLPVLDPLSFGQNSAAN